MRAEIFVHKPHQRRRLLLFFCRFVCKYLCKKTCLLGAQPEKHLNAHQFAYICNSHHVVISKNKLNKYISFLHALPDWLYHVMMVANNHLPAYNHCPFDLEMLAGSEYSWQYIGWDLAWVRIWWLGYRDNGWVGRGGLGLDSLTGLVWLGSLLADHRLGVVTGHVVELDTVAKQKNNNRSASGGLSFSSISTS